MAADSIDFNGQVAVVTGAGGGLGQGYALELARRGARVVVNDLGTGADGAGLADQTVAQIVGLGGEAMVSRDSVSTPEGGSAIIDAAVDAFGRVDVVINNAGILRNGYFDELEQHDIDAVLDVHLNAAFHVTRPAWSLMKAQGFGRVVLTASASGAFGLVGQANYGAAKGGLMGLGRVLALEGYEHGINVNCILPMAATTIADNSPIPDFWHHAARWLPDGPPTGLAARRERELVAALVVFLCSRECDLTGEAYSVCGGRYARVFTGVADGWLAPDGPASVEDVVEHLPAIRDLSHYTVPRALHEEIAGVADQARRLAQGVAG